MHLTVAFALILPVMVGAIALPVDLTAGQAFRRYLSFTNSSLHQTVEERLAGWYQVNGTWQRVESILCHTFLTVSDGRTVPGRAAATT